MEIESPRHIDLPVQSRLFRRSFLSVFSTDREPKVTESEVKLKMELAIGMDVHAKNCTAFFSYAAGDQGDILYEDNELLMSLNETFRSVPSTEESMLRLKNAIGLRKHSILIENSTKAHEIYWILKNMGLNVFVAHATDLFRITKSHKKTDHHDAVELSAYMRRRIMGEKEFSVCYMAPPEWMLRREMCRIAAEDGDILGDIRRKIRSHMLLHGIELPFYANDIIYPKSMIYLRTLNDPVLDSLLDRASDAKKRFNETEKKLSKEFRNDRMAQLLLTIPGVGIKTATMVSSMIVDISRFPDGAHLAAYFGVVPKKRESADSDPRCGITRRGNDRARQMLYQATIVHTNYCEDSSVTRLFERVAGPKTSSGGRRNYKKGITAASRKMLNIMYTMIVTDSEFERKDK